MNFIHLTKDKCGLRYKKNFARELSGNINCIKLYKPTKLIKIFLTFGGPCIVIYSYDKTNELH